MPKKSNVQVLIGFVDSNEFSESRKKNHRIRLQVILSVSLLGIIRS